MKDERCIKELNELIPVVSRVRQQISALDTAALGKVEILDLCSGFGYLAMFLSEMLPPETVSVITLVDKQWPRHDVRPPWKPHRLNPDHLYHPDWPIRLARSAQDLKSGGDRRNLIAGLIEATAGPVLVLGVHLCGTLSLRAVELFNANPQVSFFALKPCCLPVPTHSYRKEIWRLGGHEIRAREVCGMGKWKGGKWQGPPRGWAPVYMACIASHTRERMGRQTGKEGRAE